MQTKALPIADPGRIIKELEGLNPTSLVALRQQWPDIEQRLRGLLQQQMLGFSQCQQHWRSQWLQQGMHKEEVVRWQQEALSYTSGMAAVRSALNFYGERFRQVKDVSDVASEATIESVRRVRLELGEVASRELSAAYQAMDRLLLEVLQNRPEALVQMQAWHDDPALGWRMQRVLQQSKQPAMATEQQAIEGILAEKEALLRQRLRQQADSLENRQDAEGVERFLAAGAQTMQQLLPLRLQRMQGAADGWKQWLQANGIGDAVAAEQSLAAWFEVAKQVDVARGAQEETWNLIIAAAPPVPWEQAKGWLEDFATTLGEPMQGWLHTAMQDGLLEVAPLGYRPERAISSYWWSDAEGKVLPFVHMAYTGDVRHLATLVHELGHSAMQLASGGVPGMAVNEGIAIVMEQWFSHYLSQRDDVPQAVKEAMQLSVTKNHWSLMARYSGYAEFEARLYRYVEAHGTNGLDVAALDALYQPIAERIGKPRYRADEKPAMTDLHHQHGWLYLARDWVMADHYNAAYLLAMQLAQTACLPQNAQEWRERGKAIGEVLPKGSDLHYDVLLQAVGAPALAEVEHKALQQTLVQQLQAHGRKVEGDAALLHVAKQCGCGEVAVLVA